MSRHRPNASVSNVIIDLIACRQDAIAGLCDRFGMDALDAFGSAATGAIDDRSSHADFIVR